MPYMLLIHEPIGQRAARGEAQGRVVFDRMLRWGGELKARGLLLATQSLAGQDEGAARIQVRDGQTQLLDGPFAEAKEMVGGFFLLDCASRDEALALARECPAAQWATIEVRATGPCFADLL
ncbi:YciI family protein [uncultured Ramlibacter sp.]|uniref:YciI family protein n=1 Tax=uncultured Ramlibacter sp. TaxID=260755 RepID=UPI002628B260|nr:YciI family protein [uncultured Ramlibacter sp.]